LHVLARRQLAGAAPVHVRDLPDRAQLRGGDDAARDLHAQHERPDLRLVVVKAPPLQPDDVLLVDLLVAGGDQRGQLVEDPERALVALQALDGVPFEDELERRGFLHGCQYYKKCSYGSGGFKPNALSFEVAWPRSASLPCSGPK